MSRPDPRRIAHATVVITLDDGTKFAYLIEGDPASECVVSQENHFIDDYSRHGYVRKVPNGYYDITFALTNVRIPEQTMTEPPKAVGAASKEVSG